MKLSEMRKLPKENFAQEIESRKKQLMELRFQVSMNSLIKTHRVSQLRKEIAQLNTILSEIQREEDKK